MKRKAWMSLALSFALLAAGGPAAAQTAAAAFEAGKDYEVLSPAQPTIGDASKVEVAEVFMFGCPHCFNFEPRLEAWITKAPDYVRVARIPAPWNPLATLHARAYYTAELLGKTDEIVKPFFDEFHVNHDYLDSETKLAKFFARFGVDETKFHNTFTSIAVDAQVSRAADLVKRYQVPGTPAVVVNGKYLTNGAMAGSYERWFEIIDYLVEREHSGATAQSANR